MLTNPGQKTIRLPTLVPKVYLPSHAPAIAHGLYLLVPDQDFTTTTPTSTINITVTSTTTTTTTTAITTTPTATTDTTTTATTTNDNNNNKKFIFSSKIRIKWPLKDISCKSQVLFH